MLFGQAYQVRRRGPILALHSSDGALRAPGANGEGQSRGPAPKVARPAHTTVRGARWQQARSEGDAAITTSLHIAFTPLHVIRATQIAASDQSRRSALAWVPNFPNPSGFSAMSAWSNTVFDAQFLLEPPYRRTKASVATRHWDLLRHLSRAVRQVRPESVFVYADGTAAVQAAVRRAQRQRPSCELIYVEDGLDVYTQKNSTTDARAFRSTKRALERLVYGPNWTREGRLGTRFKYHRRLATYPGLVVDELAGPDSQWSELPYLDGTVQQALHELSQLWCRSVAEPDNAALVLLPLTVAGNKSVSPYMKEPLSCLRESGLSLLIKAHPGDSATQFPDLMPGTVMPVDIPAEAIALAWEDAIQVVVGDCTTALYTIPTIAPSIVSVSVGRLLGPALERCVRTLARLGVNAPSSMQELLNALEDITGTPA